MGAGPGAATRIMHRYLGRVIAASTEDERVHVTFAQVLHLLEPGRAAARAGGLEATASQRFLRGAATTAVHP